MKAIHEEMSRIWLKEEIKAKQRSRDRDITEGDRNTKYFHTVAKERRRKTLVHSLQGTDGPIIDYKDMLGVAVDNYKDLFRKEDRISCSLVDEGMTPRIHDIGLPATAQEQEGRSKPKKPKTS
jgi:hypothetical protein